MECIEVISTSDIKLFHLVIETVYASEKNYIPHLIEDVEAILSSPKDHSNIKRWVILDNGKPVGRIAAFPTLTLNLGGLGFFECINDESIAHKLFATGINWLNEQGITKVQAPINRGERDKYWGLLIHGFTPNNYQENYNPVYYKRLFETYGFVPDFNQITYRIDKNNFDVQRISRLYNRVIQNSNFRFNHFDIRYMEQFAIDFATIYNLAWQHKAEHSVLSKERVLELFKEMKPVLQDNLIWMAYHGNEPIGFFVNILEINYALKYFKGKNSILGALQYFIKRKTNPPDTSRGIVFGIVPQYQND